VLGLGALSITQDTEMYDEENVTVVYRMKPTREKSAKEIAERIALDGSVGTWQEIPGRIGSEDFGVLRGKYGAKVAALWELHDEAVMFAKFPVVNFETEYGGMPLLIGTVAGDILGLDGISKIEVHDVFLPKSFMKHFRGPALGIKGIREKFGNEAGPILAFSVKPRLGLDSNSFASVCKEAAEGGVDLVEDDERLVDPPYCRLEQRAKTASKMVHEAGKFYSLNITGRAEKIIEIARKAIEQWEVDSLKIDVLPAGFAALQVVSEHIHSLAADSKVPITVYPQMYSIWCNHRNNFFINRKVILKMIRLVGGDIIYAASPREQEIGRMDVDAIPAIKDYHKVLQDEWMNILPSLPTLTGGIRPGTLQVVYDLFGNDVGYFVGGAIAAHPMGIKKGAEAMRDAIDAITSGKTIPEYANKKPALRTALERFGYLDAHKFFQEHAYVSRHTIPPNKYAA
jgi:ribulose-bisphosphate carboxylase large chain